MGFSLFRYYFVVIQCGGVPFVAEWVLVSMEIIVLKIESHLRMVWGLYYAQCMSLMLSLLFCIFSRLPLRIWRYIIAWQKYRKVVAEFSSVKRLNNKGDFISIKMLTTEVEDGDEEIGFWSLKGDVDVVRTERMRVNDNILWAAGEVVKCTDRHRIRDIQTQRSRGRTVDIGEQKGSTMGVLGAHTGRKFRLHCPRCPCTTPPSGLAK